MDFRDVRAGRVVLVPHCAANQNARLPGCAERPAAVVELVAGLMDRRIGICQMPCPELMVLGLDREGVNIYDALDAPAARAACRRMARDLCRQVRQYLDGGVAVLGVLGKNGSPSCGVEETWRERRGPGMGVFVQELAAELTERGIALPLAGTMDAEPDAALAVVDEWLAARAGPP